MLICILFCYYVSVNVQYFEGICIGFVFAIQMKRIGLKRGTGLLKSRCSLLVWPPGGVFSAADCPLVLIAPSFVCVEPLARYSVLSVSPPCDGRLLEPSFSLLTSKHCWRVCSLETNTHTHTHTLLLMVGSFLSAEKRQNDQ